MKTFKSFLLGVVLALCVVLGLSGLLLLTGCIHTEIDLTTGHYSSTAVFASRQARTIDVKLGPDKGVKVTGYGQDATEVAKQALTAAQDALNKVP